MQADDVGSRPQHQMKRVSEDDLCPGRGNLFRTDRPDRTDGSDRHERRGVDKPAGKVDPALPGITVGMIQGVFHWGARDSRIMASP